MSSNVLNIHNVVKQRFIGHIFAHAQNNSYSHNTDFGVNQIDKWNYSVLIVDDVSLPIVSSCFDNSNILDYKIVIIENIKKKKKPFPCFEAIYFVKPSVENVQQISKDFESSSNPPYKHLHIFFTSTIREKNKLFSILKTSPGVVSNLKTFLELNLNFVPFETNIFYTSPPISFLDSMTLDVDHIKTVVDQLYSICVSFGDRPCIRYQRSESKTNETIAKNLYNKILECDLRNFTFGKTTILILDRTIDMSCLFSHDFTYQGLLYDLFKIHPITSNYELTDESISFITNLNVVSLVHDESSVKPNQTVAYLSENDNFYSEVRHCHIASVLETIASRLKLICVDCKDDFNTTQAMKSLLCQDDYEKLKTHKSISEKAFHMIINNSLNDVIVVEQQLTTGVTEKGKPLSVKQLTKDIKSLLQSHTIQKLDKIRILLLYRILISGIQFDDWKELINSSNLSLEDIHFYTILDNLCTPLSSNSEQKKRHIYANDAKRIKYYTKLSKKNDILYFRYQPYIRFLITEFIKNKLSKNVFPIYTESSISMEINKNEGKNKSYELQTMKSNSIDDRVLKKKIFSKGPLVPKNSHTFNLSENEKPILIIYIVGGITFSEMKQIYDFANNKSCNIFLGGSTILVPSLLLEELQKYSK